MNAKTEQIFKEVLSLPEPERWDLVARMLEHLNTEVDRDDDEAAWAVEIERRIEDFETGREKGIPAAQVFADIRKKLRLS